MRKNNLTTIIYLSIISLISLLLFSYTTSPCYVETSAGDSAIFQIIGKYWGKGYIPYGDLWDLKGPIIFFINYIGYMLTNSATGIFIIQWLCLGITLHIMYSLLRKEIKAQPSCFLLLLPVVSFAANTWGGNCVEEYALPLMALSYMFIYKWLFDVENEKATTHPWKYAFVYGLTFSFCLLTRLTNALGLCAAVAIISIWLMVKGSWKNLGANILAFLAGVAILLVPFMAYFASKGALYDMWYGTILYNLDYAAASSNDATTIKGIMQLFIHFLDTWMLLLVGILTIIVNNKRRLAGLVWTCVALFSLAWFVRGNAFAHYGVISIPLIAVTFIETKKLVKCVSKRRTEVVARRLAVCVLSVYFIITLGSCWHTYSLSKSQYIPNKELAETREFMKDVPQSFKASFVSYNGEIDYYLYDNIKPAFRFFSLQDYEASQSPSLQQYLREDFAKSNVKWILVKDGAKFIEPILKEKYHIYKQDKTKGLTLYSLD